MYRDIPTYNTLFPRKKKTMEETPNKEKTSRAKKRMPNKCSKSRCAKNRNNANRPSLIERNPPFEEPRRMGRKKRAKKGEISNKEER